MIESKNNVAECPICGCETVEPGKYPFCVEYFYHRINCPRCGLYGAYEIGFKLLQNENFSEIQIACISGYLRENSDTKFDEKLVEYVKKLRPPSVPEKGEKLLRYLARKYPKAGQEIDFQSIGMGSHQSAFFNVNDESGDALEMIATAWACDPEELIFIVERYLIDSQQLLIPLSEDLSAICYISPEGWTYLDELTARNAESDIGFIAMWFAEEVGDLFTQAIGPAISDAGYRPERIDKLEHINKIDDEIIAMIRRSRFVVADFTGQRGGVYYEAGFAQGLNIPVIWICREDEIDDVHFDNRQYNFILWEPDNLPEAKKALQNRIEAVIGQGPRGRE